jgi:hypothetical protein
MIIKLKYMEFIKVKEKEVLMKIRRKRHVFLEYRQTYSLLEILKTFSKREFKNYKKFFNDL